MKNTQKTTSIFREVRGKRGEFGKRRTQPVASHRIKQTALTQPEDCGDVATQNTTHYTILGANGRSIKSPLTGDTLRRRDRPSKTLSRNVGRSRADGNQLDGYTYHRF
jgi:hypothetical protein